MDVNQSTRASGFGTIKHIRNGEQIPIWDHNALGRGLVKLFGGQMFKRDHKTIVGRLLYWLSRQPMCGFWAPELCFTNTITTAGYAGIAGLLTGADSIPVFIYIAVGTGTTPATSADTILEAEIHDSGFAVGADERYAGTPTRETTTETKDTSQVTKTFAATASKMVTEYGLFNAITAGIMYCRTTAIGIPLVNNDQLAVTWKIKHSA